MFVLISIGTLRILTLRKVSFDLMYLDVSDSWYGARWYLYSSKLVLKIKELSNDSLNWGPVGKEVSS